MRGTRCWQIAVLTTGQFLIKTSKHLTLDLGQYYLIFMAGIYIVFRLTPFSKTLPLSPLFLLLNGGKQ